MVLVTLSVGAIAPIVALVVEDDIVGKFPMIGPILDYLGKPDRALLLLIVVAGFFLIIILKAAATFIILVVQRTLLTDIRVDLSSRLFKHYLSQPVSFHMLENSAKILRSLSGDISGHGRCLESVSLIFTEALLVCALVILLLWVDPFGLIFAIGVMTVSGFFYFRFIQPKIGVWGVSFREESAFMIKHAQQALGAIKEIKILNRENFFSIAFKKSVGQMMDVQRKHLIAQAIPSNALEILIAASILFLVFGAYWRGTQISEFLPVLALFAASAIRLAPSLARIAGALQTVRYNRPGMKALYDQLKKGIDTKSDNVFVEKSLESLDEWQNLKISNLSFSYSMRGDFSLHGINIAVRRGRSIGIIGASGSGKSTFLDIILGLIDDYHGKIEIDGTDLRCMRMAWQAHIGYVPQSVYLIDDSLRENIALGIPSGKIDGELLNQAIEKAQLSEFVASLSHGMDTIVGERGTQLSGGQQQRVGIARALYRCPSVLVLDEATSALDSVTEKDLMRTVFQMHGAITMFVIAHRLSTLQGCDHIIRFENGRIVQEGSFQQVVSESGKILS
jgi:ATP-binding cassette, subfamily B, bacterial PglK